MHRKTHRLTLNSARKHCFRLRDRHHRQPRITKLQRQAPRRHEAVEAWLKSAVSHDNTPADTQVWRQAPFLTGTTRFEPLPGIRNILVTGGSGFIGSWVVRHLASTYADAYNIVNFDKLDYCSSTNNTAALDSLPNYTFCKGDITKEEEVVEFMKTRNIDTVLHFAAQSHVDKSFHDPFSFTFNNAYGTHVMLESARKLGVKRFIHVSTDEVYGEARPGEQGVTEDSALDPTNPYSASKAAAEMVARAYLKSFQVPVIIVRGNNVYGPHQFPEKIIPKFSCLAHQGQALTIHGDGRNSRRYVYAADVADAFDTILHKGLVGETYNISSRDELSNVEVAERILADTAREAPGQAQTQEKSKGVASRESTSSIVFVPDRPFNDFRYAVDGSKLTALGWTQKTGFEDGLRDTVAWYRQFGERWWALPGARKKEKKAMLPSPTPSTCHAVT